MLTVERLTREGVFTDISFDVRAGRDRRARRAWSASGRSEVARAVFGIDRYDAGAVTVRGQRAAPRRRRPPRWRRGSASCPRTAGSRAWSWTCRCSRTSRSPRSAGCAEAGLIRAAAERAFAADWAVRLKIKYGRLTDPVSTLSGGNQQKVVLAKWLGRKPALLIVDEPTRGHRRRDQGRGAPAARRARRASGVAILMISSELPEVLGVSDRILVMREGRLVAEFSHAEASEESIMAAATGQPVQKRGRHDVHADRAAAPTSAPRRGPAPRRLAERVFRIRESGIVAVLVVFVAHHRGHPAPVPRARTNIQFLLVNTTVSRCSRSARRWW